jgi:hypothetical protein
VISVLKVSRIVARAWIEGKGWAGKGATRDEARSNLIKYLKVMLLKEEYRYRYHFAANTFNIPVPIVLRLFRAFVSVVTGPNLFIC